MQILEITGEPCAGKSTAVNTLGSVDGVHVFDINFALARGSTSSPGVRHRVLYEVCMFWHGVRGAGFRRLVRFLRACWGVSEGIATRANMFRNVVHKYGMHRIAALRESPDVVVIDEGIAHLPFLFTGHCAQVDDSLFFDFPGQSPTVIKYTVNKEELVSRLRVRGHKRLRRGAKRLEDFVADNQVCGTVQDRLLVKHGVAVYVSPTEVSKSVSDIRQIVAEMGDRDAVDLSPLRGLFLEFKQAGITVCSWKNNHLLSDSLACRRDLDLYVPLFYRAAFVDILTKHGYFEGDAGLSGHADIAHYYNLGSEHQLRHLHVYYKLMTGESHLKDYRLPLEDDLVSGCDFYKGWLPVPRPGLQKLIYLIRHFLKNSTFAGILMSYREAGRYRAELDTLSSIKAEACPSGGIGDEFVFEMERSLGSGGPFSVWLTGSRLRRILRDSRSLNPIQATWKRYANLTARIVNKFLWREKKTLPGGGRFIAITGLDGSGKSTLIRHVTEVLTRDFTVHSVHLGRPPATLVTLPVRIALRIRSAIRSESTTTSERCTREGGTVSGFTAAIRYAALAHERLRLGQRVARWVSGGHLVISDRYPSTTQGKMDSPRLVISSSGWLINWLVRYEQRCHAAILKPNLLIVLEVSEATSVQRNKDRVKADKETTEEISTRYSQNRGLIYDVPEVKTLWNEMPAEQAKQETLSMVLDSLRERPVQTG